MCKNEPYIETQEVDLLGLTRRLRTRGEGGLSAVGMYWLGKTHLKVRCSVYRYFQKARPRDHLIIGHH